MLVEGNVAGNRLPFDPQAQGSIPWGPTVDLRKRLRLVRNLRLWPLVGTAFRTMTDAMLRPAPAPATKPTARVSRASCGGTNSEEGSGRPCDPDPCCRPPFLAAVIGWSGCRRRSGRSVTASRWRSSPTRTGPPCAARSQGRWRAGGGGPVTAQALEAAPVVDASVSTGGGCWTDQCSDDGGAGRGGLFLVQGARRAPRLVAMASWSAAAASYAAVVDVATQGPSAEPGTALVHELPSAVATGARTQARGTGDAPRRRACGCERADYGSECRARLSSVGSPSGLHAWARSRTSSAREPG
jgi:hypothetical protein